MINWSKHVKTSHLCIWTECLTVDVESSFKKTPAMVSSLDWVRRVEWWTYLCAFILQLFPCKDPFQEHFWTLLCYQSEILVSNIDGSGDFFDTEPAVKKHAEYKIVPRPELYNWSYLQIILPWSKDLISWSCPLKSGLPVSEELTNVLKYVFTGMNLFISKPALTGYL